MVTDSVSLPSDAVPFDRYKLAMATPHDPRSRHGPRFDHATRRHAQDVGTMRNVPICLSPIILLLPEGPRVLGNLIRGPLLVRNALALGDLEQGAVLHEMETPGGMQGFIAWSPNGKWAAFRSKQPPDAVVILDVHAWRKRGVLKIAPGIDPQFGMAITSDGNSLFAMDEVGLLRQWDLRELK